MFQGKHKYIKPTFLHLNITILGNILSDIRIIFFI